MMPQRALCALDLSSCLCQHEAEEGGSFTAWRPMSCARTVLLRGKRNERFVVFIPGRYEDRQRCRKVAQRDGGNLVAAFPKIFRQVSGAFYDDDFKSMACQRLTMMNRADRVQRMPMRGGCRLGAASQVLFSDDC